MFIIDDNFPLLRKMSNDMKKQELIYKPGPFWINKTIISEKSIYNDGLSNFRGYNSSIGTSFSDNIIFDMRKSLIRNTPHKILKYFVEKVYPINLIFDEQVLLTKSAVDSMLNYKSQNLIKHPKVDYLISKYVIPYSLLGGCIDYIEISNKKISSHYLNLLDQLDYSISNIDIYNINSILEIGGGFGVNIHLLIENFKNIKKILYLDIPPNLYVGTQYLKAFFGDSIIDYSITRNLEEIRFSNNNDLEIIAIAPWQLVKFKSSVDVLWNAHSFIEMPENVIMNYVNLLQKMDNYSKIKIVLISYSNSNESKTIDSNKLDQYFVDKNFIKLSCTSLIDSSKKNLILISN